MKFDPTFQRILDDAYGAAHDAVRGLEDRCACGFAWVEIAGNTPFGRYCSRMEKIEREADVSYEASNRYGRKDYKPGRVFWNPSRAHVQAVDVLERGAVAFAAVLTKHGIEAHSRSRLD